MMKLTRRQEEFLENLVDLNQEYNGPIHYSQLAERLGVSPITAYDMLCKLEEKGVVASQYRLAREKCGPGRAERVFYRREQNTHQSGSSADRHNPDDLLTIEIPRNGELSEDHSTQENAPTDENTEISYCVNVLTIAALRLQGGSGINAHRAYIQKILEPNLASREKLSLLGGFAFGILAQDRNWNDEFTHKLSGHIDQYLKIVAHLIPEECDQLAKALTGKFSLIDSALLDDSLE